MNNKNIYIFKLKSGEEFIAEVVKVSEEGSQHISNPAVAVPHPDDPSKMMLVPWNVSNWLEKPELRLNRKDFLFIEPARKEIASAHNEAFSTIKIAQPGNILLG